MAETLAEKAYRLGKEYELTYKGCAQCTIAALQDALEVKSDDVFKAATALAAGGGMTADGSCGSYVGAILVLGSLTGRDRENFKDPEGLRFRAYKLARVFRERYINEYGSVICRDIQTRVLGRPYYIVDPDEFRKFEEAGAHSPQGCPEVVAKAARWMAEIAVAEKLLNR